MIVVDASVAAKWFLPEADAEAALWLLRGGEKLVAPELIRVEVTSAIVRRNREGELPLIWARKSRDAWFQALQRDVVFLHPNKDDLDVASELAMELNHPLADCIYLALAKRIDVPFVTSDDKFIKKAKKHSSQLVTLREIAKTASK